jgi:ABC-2 type transport system permease protein
MTVAFELGGGPRDRRDRDFFALATHSGLNLPLAALGAMSTFLLPIVVVIFAGGSVAEEASWGSLRYLLIRPIRRSSLLASKLAVVAILSLLAVLLVLVASLAEGIITFGWHPVITPDFTVIAPGTAVARIVLSALYVGWSMSGIIAVAFFVSTLTDASIGAVSAGIGLAIVSQIVDAIPQVGRIRSVLPTHFWHAWENLFANPVHTDHMVRGVLLQLPYLAVFLGLAWWWFQRKDITS